MAIEAVSYQHGGPGNPYLGRISLQLFSDERFVASYHHRKLVNQWEGRLTEGTFARACEALTDAGFPDVPGFKELVPGEYPLELGWLRDGAWQRGETLERRKFWKISIIASSILTVVDSNLARMPPGETTPVIEQHRVEVLG